MPPFQKRDSDLGQHVAFGVPCCLVASPAIRFLSFVVGLPFSPLKIKLLAGDLRAAQVNLQDLPPDSTEGSKEGDNVPFAWKGSPYGGPYT